MTGFCYTSGSPTLKAEDELAILGLARQEARQGYDPTELSPVTQETVFAARNEALDTYMGRKP